MALVAVIVTGLSVALMTKNDDAGSGLHHNVAAVSTTSGSSCVGGGAIGPVEASKGTRACILESESFPQIVDQLAAKLSLPVLSEKDLQSLDAAVPSHALSVEPYTAAGNNILLQDYFVGIRQLDSNNDDSKRRRRRRKQKRSIISTNSRPFYVDLCPPTSSRLGQRSSSGHRRQSPDLLLKAVSVRGKVVYDLTAGFGQDSLVMARAGAAKHVCMVERDPIVATLLDDALRRLTTVILSTKGSCDESTRETALALSNCLSLECNDGKQVIQNMILLAADDDNDSPERPDVVYLDPMFPARKKSASVKKNMQILHSLLDSQQQQQQPETNDDDDDVSARQHRRCEEEESLLQAAYQAAKDRVVVKRPIHAPPIGTAERNTNLRPSYEISGSINRWDVYLKGNNKNDG